LFSLTRSAFLSFFPLAPRGFETTHDVRAARLFGRLLACLFAFWLSSLAIVASSRERERGREIEREKGKRKMKKKVRKMKEGCGGVRSTRHFSSPQLFEFSRALRTRRMFSREIHVNWNVDVSPPPQQPPSAASRYSA